MLIFRYQPIKFPDSLSRQKAGGIFMPSQQRLHFFFFHEQIADEHGLRAENRAGITAARGLNQIN